MVPSKSRLLAIDKWIVVLLILNLVLAVRMFVGRQPSEFVTGSSNDNSNNRPVVKRMIDDSKPSQASQAQKLLGQVKLGLHQPASFPFQPTWSNKTFNPEEEIDADLLDRLKTHVRLRQFYTSNASLTPGFKHL